MRGGEGDHLVMDASSMDVTSGDGTLVGPLLGPADSAVGGARRSARRVRTRNTGRRNGGVGRNGGGGRVRRAIFSEGDNIGTRNSESIEFVGIDVGPLNAIVHSREAGEIAGGRLVSASVLHVDLTMEEISLSHWSANRTQKEYIHATWIVLGISNRVKCNDLIANQL